MSTISTSTPSISFYLAHEGFETYEARDRHEAVARARSLRPAVIVMDLTMPGLDGWEATRPIKADPGLREIHVIVLTGHALDADAENEARAAGCESGRPWDISWRPQPRRLPTPRGGHVKRGRDPHA